jgi:NlpC/P60 family protein
MASSRPLRRLAAASLAFACALAVQAPAGAAGGDVAARERVRGESGSGMPMLRIVRTERTADDITWSDVPKGFWATAAIDYVAGTNAWMRDFPASDDGTYRFRPRKPESRRLFARAIVRAFAPTEPVDESVSFTDLVSTDRFFASANVAVRLGWMTTDADGGFRPMDPVTTVEAHEALVDAVGLGDLATAAEGIHLRNGTTFDVPDGFGAMLIGMRIGLRYNHGDEALDVGPESPLSRAEAAWSLFRAATMPTWVPSSLAPYADIRLPNLGPAKQAILQWGIDYVGYPYVWGGEWDAPTATGYCCGTQPIGGFDCSGLAWWVMKAADVTWDNSPPRPYPGWPLPQRTSADMAANGGKVSWDELRAADLMFYDGDGDGRVDHVDTYIGNGWAIDSSGSPGGVTIMWVGTGWYADHFVHGRRIFGTTLE